MKTPDQWSVWLTSNFPEMSLSERNSIIDFATMEEVKKADQLYLAVAIKMSVDYNAGKIKKYDATDVALAAMHEYASQQTVSLREENQRLKNDLLDALDVKQGSGPTALSMLSEENKLLREALEANDAMIQRIYSRINSSNDWSLEFLQEVRTVMMNNLTQLSTTNGKQG